MPPNGHTIDDEGVALAQRSSLNFAGSAVVVTDNAGADSTDVTISTGLSHVIQDEAASLPQRTKLNFTGDAVVVTDVAVSDRTDVTIAIGAASVSNVDGSLTFNPTTGAIVGSLTVPVTVPRGGTGLTSFTIGDLPYANTATSIAALADVATGNVLLSGGVGAAPAYGKVNLGSHVTGNLPVGNLNSGTGANATSYWRGDGSWATPAGSGTVTHTASALTASRLVVGNTADDLTVLASLGTTTTVLHGNAAGLPTFAAVSLTADVSGNLPVTNLNSGTAAGATTFWRGDGVWETPSGSGGTSFGMIFALQLARIFL